VLVKEPPVIILDEPTSGLDPEAARDFLDIIRSLKLNGITVLLSSHLLVIGIALLVLGVPPSPEEVGRSLVFLLATLFYAGVWLTLAILFSVVFRQPATSALAALGVWLLFAIFWNMLAGLVGSLASTPLGQAMTQIWFARLSPNTLFAEAMTGVLDPTTRALGPILYSQMEGALPGTPLPFGQSVLLIWPQLTGLIAEVILLLTGTCVLFQRQEIRA
ncbi:MAG TPA: ABC transporter permease subunit, partial [Spirochaetia bacterium]|nr:ABC transporter permease subunit [Spirochaetia bacterium]